MELLIIFLLISGLLWLIFSQSRPLRQKGEDDSSGELEMNKEAGTLTSPLVYQGENLDFSEEVLRRVLLKHFPFYSKLIPPDQDKFLYRLRKFIKSKIFVIHDVKGYREMPILISSAAVQLSFGLNKFLMPHFTIIQIYPQEFIALEPMRVLIGNVSGNTINIAWKQFLEGYKNRFDNSNVGLHEMAHALYYQNFEAEEHIDKNFQHSFHHFMSLGDKVFEREKLLTIGLYSDYAMKNFQEFWAESIEIFFEAPERLNLHYPDLYSMLCDLLCQDPLNYPNHNYSV
jgi:Mlc titration factor MtfA (ptsG expression regulator)